MSSVQIKDLENKDFLDLVNLYVNLKDHVYCYKKDVYITIASLVNDSFKPCFTAVGLYSLDRMVGFVTGFAKSSDEFFISSLYIKEGYRKNLSTLFYYFTDKVKSFGYTSYRLDSNSKNISSVMEKLGSVKTIVQYEGVL
jgi:hypothetical protein